MKRPNEMWAFWANTFGASFKTPRKVKWDQEHRCWWHSDGNHAIYKVGLESQGWVAFAHPEKKRVQAFMDGYKAAQDMMRNVLEEGE